MSTRDPFSAQEWQALQFAVLDVMMLVSQADAIDAVVHGRAGPPSGIDAAEAAAFANLLKNPAIIDNLVLRGLLATLAATGQQVLDAYKSQFQSNAAYFEQGFSRVRAIIDSKLSTSEAQDFKAALAFNWGSVIANAFGAPGSGQISDAELKTISTIAEWLRLDVPQWLAESSQTGVPPTEQGTLNALLHKLQHGSASERADAATSILDEDEEAKQAAVPALIEALADENSDVRSNIVEALGLMGDAALPAIPALIRTLADDKNSTVQENAAFAIRMLSEADLHSYNSQIVPVLIKSLSAPSSVVRGYAAVALGNLDLPDPAQVIAALQKAAENKNEDEEVKLGVCLALGKILSAPIDSIVLEGLETKTDFVDQYDFLASLRLKDETMNSVVWARIGELAGDGLVEVSGDTDRPTIKITTRGKETLERKGRLDEKQKSEFMLKAWPPVEIVKLHALLQTTLGINRIDFAQILGSDVTTVELWELGAGHPSLGQQYTLDWLENNPSLLAVLRTNPSLARSLAEDPSQPFASGMPPTLLSKIAGGYWWKKHKII
jgi:DNA-binding transcriptional regulator YiaG